MTTVFFVTLWLLVNTWLGLAWFLVFEKDCIFTGDAEDFIGLAIVAVFSIFGYFLICKICQFVYRSIKDYKKKPDSGFGYQPKDNKEIPPPPTTGSNIVC